MCLANHSLQHPLFSLVLAATAATVVLPEVIPVYLFSKSGRGPAAEGVAKGTPVRQEGPVLTHGELPVTPRPQSRISARVCVRFLCVKLGIEWHRHMKSHVEMKSNIDI